MPTTSDLPQDERPPLRLVQAAPADKPEDLVGALAIRSPRPVVVLAGGDVEIDPALQPRLTQLVGRGLVRALHECGAVAVLRGAGALAEMVGKAVDESAGASPLVGVGPAGAVAVPGAPAAAGGARLPMAPGLTHLLLTTGADWGSELRTKIELARALAASNPVSMIVIGGGAAVTTEVLQAVRRRWPVLIVQGSGGAADTLARQALAQAADSDDPVVAEILADGQITCIALGDKVAEAVETLARQVLRDAGGESVLRQAWRRFAALDTAAVRQQREFFQVQWWILALGIAAVALAIVQMLLKDVAKDRPGWQALADGLRYLLIALPIVTSMLIAATNRFKPGKRWVLLRSAAEAIKREIYRFRLRASSYASDDSREKNFAKAVEDITRRLARTEANTTALPAYAGPIPPKYAAGEGDDGMSPLDTDQYVRMRLADQLAFYRNKTVGLERELRTHQLAVLAAGAVGTLLAALGDPWVIGIALTTAVSSALLTYLSYRQVETTLTGYNQVATDLENIQAWWTALTPMEQAGRDNIEALATHTEDVLGDELSGWTQRMTDALEKLRGKDEKEEKDDKGGGDDGSGGAGGADGGAASPAPPPEAVPAPAP